MVCVGCGIQVFFQNTELLFLIWIGGFGCRNPRRVFSRRKRNSSPTCSFLSPPHSPRGAGKQMRMLAAIEHVGFVLGLDGVGARNHDDARRIDRAIRSGTGLLSRYLIEGVAMISPCTGSPLPLSLAITREAAASIVSASNDWRRSPGCLMTWVSLFQFQALGLRRAGLCFLAQSAEFLFAGGIRVDYTSVTSVARHWAHASRMRCRYAGLAGCVVRRQTSVIFSDYLPVCDSQHGLREFQFPAGREFAARTCAAEFHKSTAGRQQEDAAETY